MTYQNHKTEILRAITDVYSRHGKGIDLIIKVSYLVVSVTLTDFHLGKVIGQEKFYVEVQMGSAQDCYAFTLSNMEKALHKLGVEFLSIDNASTKAGGAENRAGV